LSQPGREFIREAIRIANQAADRPGDDEFTPSELAEPIRDALESRDLSGDHQLIKYLHEALDSVSDGMPPDYTAMLLYSALGRLQEG